MNNIAMAGVELIYDLIRLFCEQLSTLDVELILALLRCCGFKIRQDDPVSLQQIVRHVAQRRAKVNDAASNNTSSKIDKEAGSSTRLKLMLDMISDLKANRDGAFGVNTLGSARARALLDWVNSADSKTKKGSSTECTLPVRWEMLVADRRAKTGIWWFESVDAMRRRIAIQKGESVEVAGAAGISRRQQVVKDTLDAALDDGDLLALARKCRMNTDLRKSIFCVVMGSDDYEEAARGLEKLRLKPPKDREIPRVLLELAMRERNYNPFYGSLLKRICESNETGKGHGYVSLLCLASTVVLPQIITCFLCE